MAAFPDETITGLWMNNDGDIMIRREDRDIEIYRSGGYIDYDGKFEAPDAWVELVVAEKARAA